MPRGQGRKAGRKLSFVKEPEDSGHFTAEEEGLKENDEEGVEEEEEEEDEETVGVERSSYFNGNFVCRNVHRLFHHPECT